MDDTQIIQQQIAGAPVEIRKLLADSAWTNTIDEIARKNNFSPEQGTALQNEVLFVLLGMEIRDNLAKNIQASLGIQDILAQAVSNEVDEKIFASVRTILATEIEPEEPSVPPKPQNLSQEILAASKIAQAKITTEIEIPPENLPMVEKGETAHDTPAFAVPAPMPAPIQPIVEPIAPAPIISAPTIPAAAPEIKPEAPKFYPANKDPYREPLE